MTVPHRPARRPLPEPAEAALPLAAPPVRPAGSPGWLFGVLPALGLLPLVALGMRGSGALVLLLVVPVLVGTVGVVVGQRRYARANHTRAVSRWRAHVDDLAARCTAAADGQRLALDRRHPADLGAAIEAGWAFERRPSDADALVVAVGSGMVAARVRLEPPPVGPLDDVDPALLDVARLACARAAVLPAAPVTVDLRAAGILAVVGDPAVVDRLVAEVAVLHAPGEVAISGDDRWPHREGDVRLTVVSRYAPGARAGPAPAIVGCRRYEDVPAAAGAILDATAGTLTCGGSVVRLDHVDRLDPARTGEIARRLHALAPPVQRPALPALLDEPADDLAVPLGLDPGGAAVRLHLGEAAAGGHGPHGLLVGATGSGKSVALRTVVTGLAARHGPDRLALLLVDYKGGAAFADLADLPHVAGLVTNLADDPGLVDRMGVALGAELDRRQRTLREHGAASVREAPDVVPSLVVVIDEAGELLAAAPDVAQVLARIGRVGRSLGVHLLVSTQSWDANRLHALDAHLRYRICLRTVNPDDSRAVLGTNAARTLPSKPGAAWLAVDGELTRVDVIPAPDPAASVVPLRPGRAEAVWLPPLPTVLRWPADGSIGRLDLPARRSQPPLVARGHVAVAGAPGSGVTTALRAVVHATDAAVHVLDAGGRLRDLAELPHVGTVAGPHEPERVRAVLAAVRHQVARRAAGSGGAPLLLVVDGVAALSSADDGALQSVLADVAARGLGLGVHLAVGCRRWSELRGGLLDAARTKIELRLGDPAESIAGRARAATLPDVPGRGLLADGSECQIALPSGSVRSTLRIDPVRVLPLAVREPSGRSAAFVLGVGGVDCAPLALDMHVAGRHLVVAGDAGSGRTTVLRRLVGHLGRRAEVHVVDPRRSLPATAGDPASVLRALVAALRERLPGATSSADITCRPTIPGQSTYVVLDDVDLIAADPAAAGPLTDLAALLPYAPDVGLHVAVARPALAHAFDPLAARLRSARPWLLQLPGDHVDGPAAGRRDLALPGRGVLSRGTGAAVDVQCYLPAAERRDPDGG
ncbi:MAG TPA: FtsK/SpoIIIE domain-containing protein [Mycobacteriales bacterium]